MYVGIEERNGNMREITFRAKRKDNGDWAYGYLYGIWERRYICWGMTNDVPNMTEVIPETVSQYTGLTDKNGNKILENDIVKYESELGKSIACVSYKYDHFVLDWNVNKEFANDILRSWSKDIEVIGNVFDNADLLESEDD